MFSIAQGQECAIECQEDYVSCLVRCSTDRDCMLECVSKEEDCTVSKYKY